MKRWAMTLPRFTTDLDDEALVEYKPSMVAEYDACAGDGDVGALRRREGLYSSHIVEWQGARDNGALSGLG